MKWKVKWLTISDQVQSFNQIMVCKLCEKYQPMLKDITKHAVLRKHLFMKPRFRITRKS